MTGGGRLLFVQFGDFREASARIAATGEETYRAQRYSIEVVEGLCALRGEVAVLCLAAAEDYDVTLPSGVRALGVSGRYGDAAADRRLVAALERIDPAEVILRMPNREAIRFCLKRGIAVFPCLADSFRPRPGLRTMVDLWRFAMLGRLLRDARIPWIANHNLPASRDLVRIGAPAGKIVPWDWPAPEPPSDRPPRTAPEGRRARLLHVGAVSEAKGVGDLIRAFAGSAELRARARLTVVGKGDVEGMRALAEQLGVADDVDFVGQLSRDRVRDAMSGHDALVVFSRASYGEGMPMVIQEGLTERLPVLLSTHPMFTASFQDGRDCLFAAEGDPAALAGAALRLLDDPSLYARLSSNAEAAARRTVHPVSWGDVVVNWLRRDAEGGPWLRARSLEVWERRRAGKAS